MKKFQSVLIIVGCFLAACSKEMLDEQHLNGPSSGFNNVKLVTLTDGKSSSTTMLEFTSFEHYENTIALLDTLIEHHEDEFLATWGHLDEDALNAKEDELGFVYYQPLINFENAYNITSSMRQSFERAEDIWLNNEELDAETDPSWEYCFDLAEMTLLNTYGEVKIGDVLLKLSDRGYVRIDSLDVTTLIRIRNGDLSAYLEPTVTTNIDLDDGMKNNSDCKSWKGANYWHYYQTNRRVKMHVHFHNYPWKAVSKAKLTSYRKSGGNWKKHRMMLGVANQSIFYDTNCHLTLPMWSG